MKTKTPEKTTEKIDKAQREAEAKSLAEARAAFVGAPVAIPEVEKESSESNTKTRSVKPAKSSSGWVALLVLGVLTLCGGVACILLVLLTPEEILPDLSFPKIPSTSKTTEVYSNLTGFAVANEAAKTAPAYCVQMPNGLDGARPQAGMDQAGVVFEAIAESGITRFAAIYQAPTTAVIGPIRSLRIYYLDWDVPFDCTIVHAGGAPDALAAVRAYKDMTENYAYMYRGTAGSRLWNNLFTTSHYLEQFSTDYGYATSNVQGFARMTPEEAEQARVDGGAAEKLIITEATSANTSEIVPEVANIGVRFGGWADYNVNYKYNTASNSYDRFYETGATHEIYECPDGDLGEVNPEEHCALRQLSPAVVAVMVVQEGRASDNYHEDIATIGSGSAYVFQNGGVVQGSWTKSARDSQIKFFDNTGAEIRLVPGQTFVEAVPAYGGIEF